MKLNWNLQPIRWFVLIVISVVSIVAAYIDQNVAPLLVTLFAVIFLTAPLIKAVQHAHKVFLGRLGFATLLAIFGISAFSYVINPFGLYPPHLFEPLVLTTRDYKMNLYAAYSPRPRAVILGSSRSFTVNPTQIEQLWHYSAFNASLTGGVMQDFLGFVRYVSQAGKFPDLLIINVAPEIFRWGDNNRYTLEPDSRLWNYVDNDDPLYALKDSFYRITRLLSKEQLESSLRVLWAKATERSHLDGYIIDPNGMAYFVGTHLSADDLNPDKLAGGLWGSIFADYHPDAYRLDVLRQILEMAKQQHTVVIGYMPPYHPALRDMMETRTKFTPVVKYITSQFDIFEKEYPFHYVNFIDSESFSNSDEMFIDIIHPSIQGSALMMQQLYDQFHRYSQPS